MKKEFPSPNKLILQRDFPGKETSLKNQKEFDKENDEYLLVSSATECTGLMYAPPKTEDQAESYEQIQHFLPPGYTDRDESEEDEIKTWN